MRAFCTRLIFLIAFLLLPTFAMSQSAATLTAVGQTGCQLGAPAQCEHRQAIVFVHGIYGNNDTFRHAETGFDWPRALGRSIDRNIDVNVDVFQLSYRTHLIAWARSANPSFKEVAIAVADALKPLRVSRYQSIGFIAHSLGGNVISTYIHEMKTRLGHPQRSQNAFVITLGTPVMGAQIADMAGALKSVLGMSDNLLNSLRRGNLYLEMLQHFREQEEDKGNRYACRPVHLHAAVEGKHLGPLLIVSRDSAARPISSFVKSPIIGFSLDHSQIAKPRNVDDDVYRWVFDRLRDEYLRLATWHVARRDLEPARQLCEAMDFIPETP